jgi:hypothetical protein
LYAMWLFLTGNFGEWGYAELRVHGVLGSTHGLGALLIIRTDVL